MARRAKRRRPRHGERLTLAGGVFIGITVMMAAAALKNDSAITLILLGGMMGGLGVSAFVAGRTVRRVKITRETPDRIWQGQTVHVGYFLANARRWLSCMGLTLRELPQPTLDTVNAYCAHLPARSRFRSGARLVALARGRLALDGIEVSTQFPFSLIRAWRHVPDPRELIVWPARGRLKAELLRRGAAAISTAGPSPMTGGQDEFFGLREFRDDDNPRLIHWRRSAGRQRPLVREMTRPLPDVLVIVIDTFAPKWDTAASECREGLLRLAATLIDHAMTRSYQIGLALAVDGGVRVIRPAAGRAQLRQLLDALAEVGDNVSRPLQHTLNALPPDSLRLAQVLMLTPRTDIDAAPLLGLRAVCGHLTVIAGPQQLARVFEETAIVEEPS